MASRSHFSYNNLPILVINVVLGNNSIIICTSFVMKHYVCTDTTTRNTSKFIKIKNMVIFFLSIHTVYSLKTFKIIKKNRSESILSTIMITNNSFAFNWNVWYAVFFQYLHVYYIPLKKYVTLKMPTYENFTKTSCQHKNPIYFRSGNR